MCAIGATSSLCWDISIRRIWTSGNTGTRRKKNWVGVPYGYTAKLELCVAEEGKFYPSFANLLTEEVEKCEDMGKNLS